MYPKPPYIDKEILVDASPSCMMQSELHDAVWVDAMQSELHDAVRVDAMQSELTRCSPSWRDAVRVDAMQSEFTRYAVRVGIKKNRIFVHR
jgi:hypothetical protein